MEARIRARGELPASALRHPVAVEQDKIALGLAALGAAERGLARGQLGAPALRALLRNLYSGVFVHRGGTSAKDRFRARHGQTPGDFLVISPGKACNLRCRGCYANSGAHRERLDWTTFERTVREAHDTWGTRVFVISGGEPLAWRDGGRSFLDLAERFPDCFFVMYTNGTLIDDAVAKRLGRLGNVSPALSIEGMKERTDARRGEGVFDKVLAAMERLRREGVIIGVSLTATRENADEILSDEVVETFFDRVRRELRLRLPLHADRALVHPRPHDDAGAAAAALRAGVVAGTQPARLHRRLLELGDRDERLRRPRDARAGTSTSTGTAT